MKLYLCTLLIFSCTLLGFAQSDKQQFDSLLSVLPTLPKDTIKAQVLAQLGLSARKFDYEKALQFADELYELSADINYAWGQGKANGIRGYIQYYRGNLDSAMVFQKKALEYYQRSGDLKAVTHAYNDIGNLHADKGELSEAISMYMSGLEVAKELNDVREQAKFLGNIGSIFHEQKNYDKALEYYNKTLTINSSQSEPSPHVEMIVTNNLGEIYEDRGAFDEALSCFQRSLAIREKLNYKRGIGQTKIAIGELLYQMGETANAKKELQEGIAVLRDQNAAYSLGLGLGSLGDIALAEGDYATAINYYEESMELAKQVDALQFLRDNAEALADANEATGNYKEALAYQKQYQSYKDSVLNLETNEVIAELQTKYETKEKEQQIVAQEQLLSEQQRRITLQLIIFIISVVAIVVVAGLLINRNKLKQAAELERTIADEQKLRFRAVIEAQEQERKRIAQELHDGLGQLLSTARLNVAGLEDDVDTSDPDATRMFNNSLELIDESVQEVRNISHNMMPSALIRLGLISATKEQINKINQAGAVQVELHVEGIEDRLNESLEISLYRIIQEVLNNTLKHADADKITVNIIRANGEIQVSINDNGKGMDTRSIKDSTGIGWKNIYSRVEMMNGKLNIDSAPGQGTSFQLSVSAA